MSGPPGWLVDVGGLGFQTGSYLEGKRHSSYANLLDEFLGWIIDEYLYA